ncbi:LD-carboxypeptidase [Desulfoprunum benzoelyticum]|uniref:Muramoyltetrapeptide carboxypeptidase n=1 Tax=Desulfoprunum benzoelyticum TaxID=1506996 RepID=A0A840UYH2_9BACT|nr:LD-carboxypeptidase [Desulfoprunum benzoelyticum]MBB5346499.1 muramoyltetrapeptide carboxypeptidase [Desulfoprunum benzoelyticum]MBM9528972.1 LD-carboxypeptidase [Desulfoprunum benzoelyticum]
MRARIIPPALHKGDVIQVVAPAGRPSAVEPFRSGLAVLEQMGFVVRYPERLWPGSGFLADSDTARAEELNRAFADDRSAAIMTVRGGYGSLRILGGIDLDLVRAHPKIIVGFSDITVIHNHLLASLGLVGLHGPVLTSLAASTPDSVMRLYRCLTGSWRNAFALPGIEILRGGAKVEGILAGGNLTSLASLLGTPYDFSWQGLVVVLEDVNEPPYRLDRMLTQLAIAGKFNQAAAILLGDFSLADARLYDTGPVDQEWLWQRVLDLTAASGIPVWAGLPAGHGPENLTLPIGADVVVNSNRRSLFFC